MSQEKTFTDAEINEAIKYLENQGFERPQGRANVGQMLLTCSSSTEDVSMVVLIHSNNSIKYDISSSGGDEDCPIEIGEINTLEELRAKVAEVIG